MAGPGTLTEQELESAARLVAQGDGFVPAGPGELSGLVARAVTPEAGLAAGEAAATAGEVATVAGEVAVAAELAVPALDGLLLSVMVVAGVIIALGLLHLLQPFVRAIGYIAGKVVGFIPFVGGFVESGIRDATHYVAGLLGQAASDLDGLIAWFWNDLSKLAAWVWREISGGAHVQHGVTATVHALTSGAAARRPSPYAAGRLRVVAAELEQARRELDAAGRELDTPGMTRVAVAVQARLRPLEQELRQLDNELRRERARTENELGVAIPAKLAAQRQRTNELQAQLDRSNAEQAQTAKLVTAGAGAGLVVSALTAIGGEWLRCRNWKNIGRSMCGVPGHFLNDLLGLALDFTVLASICQVIPWLEEAFAVIAGPLIGTLAAAGSGLCSPGSRTPLELHPPRLYLPAATELELHLPG